MNEKEKTDFMMNATGDLQYFSNRAREEIEEIYKLSELKLLDKDYLTSELRTLDSILLLIFEGASSFVFANKKEWKEREEELIREGKEYDLKTRRWREVEEIEEVKK